MNLLKSYLHSFKLDKTFWTTFLIDVIAFAIIMFLFISFAQMLNAKGASISQGKAPEQLKLELASGSLETSQQFLKDVQQLAFLLIGGGMGILLLALFLSSLSQAVIWSEILHQQFSWKRYWRWNGLTVMLLFLSILYLLFYTVIRFLLNMPFSIPQTAFAILLLVINVFCAMVLLTYIFLAQYSFAQKYRVFESIGVAFFLIKNRWTVLWKAFLLALATAIIVNFILFFFLRILPRQPTWLPTAISIVILFLLVAWLRLYLVQTVHHEKPV